LKKRVRGQGEISHNAKSFTAKGETLPLKGTNGVGYEGALRKKKTGITLRQK